MVATFPEGDRRLGTREFFPFKHLGVILLFSSCSPGMFGSGVDTTIVGRPGYRHINSACAHLDISGPALDTSTFRSLLKCLNSNGGLDALERLSDKTSDEDLEPILKTINRYWLGQPKKLFEVEKSYWDLKTRNLLDPAFRELGHLLENEEFWTSLVLALREAYFAPGDDPGKGNPKILKLLERVGRRFNPNNVRIGLEAGMTVASSPASASLQARFRGPSPRGRTIRQVTDPVLEYAKPSTDPKHVEAGKALLGKLVNGQLFTVLDGVVGGPTELSGSVPRLSSSFQVLMRDDARLFDGVTSLFHYLHVPVSCLGGSKTLYDGNMHVIKAISERPSERASEFICRENVLDLMTLGPVCSYPAELGRYYPSLYQVGETNAASTLARLLRSFYEVPGFGDDPFTRHPMAALLVDILADTGSKEGPAPENTVGIKRLLPLFAELSDRGAWDDLLLLASLLKMEDRPDFQATLQWLLEPDESLGGESVYDVAMDVFSKENPETLARFVRSLSRYAQSDEKVFFPVLSRFRDAYFVNESHPFIELAGDVLKDASANEKFYSAVFKVSALPEFPAAISLLSEMGKDGRMTDLAQVLVTLFHRFAEEGRAEIATASSLPTFKSRAAHTLSKRDLTEIPVLSTESSAYKSCGLLDLGVDLSNTGGGRFSEQWEAYVSCINASGTQPGVKAALSLLNSERSERGRTHLTELFDHVRSLGLSPQAQGFSVDSFGRAFDDGRVARLLNVLPFFSSRDVHGANDAPGVRGSVGRPLVSILAPVIDRARVNLRKSQEWLASVLERTDFPAIVKHADVLWYAAEPSRGQPLDPPFDHLRIERWIRNKECHLLRGPDSERILAAEVERVKADYLNEATTWDAVPGPDGTLGVRQGWSFDEFKTFMEPLFKRYAAPEESAPGRPVLSAALQVMKYFTLPPGGRVNRYQHYTPHEFQRWLQDHAKDQKLVSYFYPLKGSDPDAGFEETPRVRYVNSLDRLEMVIVSSDLTLPVLGVNEGYKFLAMFANSWGDEDPSIWPDEIKRAYPDPRRPPPTIKESKEEILKLLRQLTRLIGMPKLPNCHQVSDPSDPLEVQIEETLDPEVRALAGSLPMLGDVENLRRRLFNLTQVISVVDDMMPRRRPDGTEYAGLKVLRDLFFELYYSTPEESRTYRENCDKRFESGPNEGRFKENICKNNLWNIMHLARAGLLHQVSRQLWKIPSDDPSLDTVLRSFLAALVPGGKLPERGSPAPRTGDLNPELLSLADTLFRKDPDRKLLWGVLRELFETIDSGDSADRASVKQTGYYGLAIVGQNGLLDPIFKSAAPLLSKNYAFLSRNAELVGDLFSSKDAARLTRVLFEDPMPLERERLLSVVRGALDHDLLQHLVSILEAADASPDWEVLRGRLRTVRDLPEYRSIDLSDVRRGLLRTLEEDTSDPAEVELSRKLRAYLIARLRAGDFDQVLLLAKKRPDEFYQLLKTAGDSVDNGDLLYFLKVLRQNLSETRP